MSAFIFVLAFFPSLNLFPFVEAEIQPIAGLFALALALWWTLRQGSIDNNIPTIYFHVFIVIVLLYLPASLALFPWKTVLQTAGSYLLGPALFYVLYRTGFRVPVRVFHVIFWGFIVIGILQYTLPLSIVNEIDGVVSPFFTRFSMGVPPDGRGNSLVYPEPSYAAPFIVLLGMVAYLVYKRGLITKQQFAAMVIADAVLVVMNRSGTVVMLCILVLVFSMLFGRIRRSAAIVAGIVFAMACIAAIGLTVDYDVRAVTLTKDFISIVSAGELFTVEAMERIASFRFISVFVGYGSILYFPLGAGIGSAHHYYGDVSEWLGIDSEVMWMFREFDLVHVKPHSFVSQAVMDLGVMAVLVHFILIVYFIRMAARFGRHGDIYIATFPLVGLFQILFDSTTTLPAPWIMMAMVAVAEEHRRKAFSACVPPKSIRRRAQIEKAT